jgi:soluble lytic murein transglycosylase-like protein
MTPQILTVAALVLALAAPAAADVYVLVEEDGTVRFSNAPTDPRYELYLREPQQEPKDPAKLVNRRNPRDSLLRSPFTLKRESERDVLANPLLRGRPFQDHIIAAAKVHRLDPALVHAIIAVESNYNANAVSRKGAVGLMQLMPDTARRYGLRQTDLKLPALNIDAGTRYLADLIRMFEGDLRLALAGYNAGESAVIRFGNKIPPFAETQDYVPRVLQFYEQLRLK